MRFLKRAAAVVVGAKAWPTAAKMAQAAARHSIVDASLVSAGVAAAAGSMGFAAYMLSQDIRSPMVNNAEYFAPFAQPRSAPRNAVASAASSRTEPPPQFLNADMTPVGSINRVDEEVSMGPLRIVGGRPDVVYLINNNSIQAVRVGDTVPGFGEVAAIAWRDGSWQLIDASGRMMLGERTEVVRNDGRLSRPMIFGR